MTGTIIKRGSKWSVVIQVGTTADGKREREWYSGFTSRDDAEQKLTKVLSEIDAGTYFSAEKITVKQFLDSEWLPSLEAAVAGGKLKPTTANGYRFLIKAYVSKRIGHLQLKELSAPALNRFYGVLLTEGGKEGRPLSRTTVHAVHVAVHRALRDAVRWGKVARNVADNAESPSKERKRMSVWAPEQTRAFLAKIADHAFSAVYVTIAMTGMRRGEVCALTWGDIDLEEGTIDINKASVVSAYKVIESTPNTARSSRQIAIDDATVSVLKAHRRNRHELRMAAGLGAFKPSDLVFVWDDGRPTHPEIVSKTFVRLVPTAKLPPIRPHDLRHSWATAALEAGVPLKVVSEHMGHSGLAVTADIYSRVRPEVDRAATDKVAALILGTSA